MKVKASCTMQLGNFMRVVNSQIARYINYILERDSQAIRERYKSPMIADFSYGLKVMQYIWLNRFKVNNSNPINDPFNSIAWRQNPELVRYFSKNTEDEELFRNLLDSDEDIYGKSAQKFTLDLLNAALGEIQEFDKTVFENSHTIGNSDYVLMRKKTLSAFRRENIP